MPTLPVTSTYFTLTINTISSGPFSLYTLLSTGVAPSGCTLGTGADINTFTGKKISFVSFQVVSGGTLYIGDSTLTGSTNVGIQVPISGVQQLSPSSIGNAWANAIYFNASANTTVINIVVIYG